MVAALEIKWANGKVDSIAADIMSLQIVRRDGQDVVVLALLCNEANSNAVRAHEPPEKKSGSFWPNNYAASTPELR